MLKAKFHGKRIRCLELKIEECIRNIFDPANVYSSQCQNFYSNMRHWLERAKWSEHFI